MNDSHHLNRSVLRRGAGNKVQTNKIQIGKPVNLLMESQLPHHDGEAMELNGTSFFSNSKAILVSKRVMSEATPTLRAATTLSTATERSTLIPQAWRRRISLPRLWRESPSS